jgi:hypothetical protein
MLELPDDHLDVLIDAAQVAVDAQQLLTHAVTTARHTGATWAQIGDAVGLTPKAAKRRWRHHQHHPNPQTHHPWLPEF